MEIDDNTININQQQNGDGAFYEKNSSMTASGPDSEQNLLEPKSEMQLLVEQIKPSSYGRRRNYSTIDISAEKWLMAYDAESLAKLENPPSLADGINQELEKEIRYLGCELIQSGAILLKLNQTAAATGQILFQRFYYQKSFVRYNFEHMVMACLLLASKIEEEPRKPRDVLNVYNRLKQLHQHRRRLNSISNKNGIGQQQQQRPRKFDHLELGGRHYLHIKNAVIKAERRILNTLGFVVHVHHPHKLIYIYLFILGLLRKADDANASAEEINKSCQLLQRAWSYMNDGLRTDMFLRYPSETIACACIQLAVKTVDQPIVLPKDPFPWFELFDASDRDVRVISEMLLNLYRRKKAPSMEWILMQLEKQQEKFAKKLEKPTEEEKDEEELRMIPQDSNCQEKSKMHSGALLEPKQKPPETLKLKEQRQQLQPPTKQNELELDRGKRAVERDEGKRRGRDDGDRDRRRERSERGRHHQNQRSTAADFFDEDVSAHRGKDRGDNHGRKREEREREERRDRFRSGRGGSRSRSPHQNRRSKNRVHKE